MTGELAQIRIEPTGMVTAIMSTHSQGHGTATTMAQLIADRLGVAYENVTVFEGDSSRGGFSRGGRQSPGCGCGGAAIKAADLLADKVRQIAGHLLDVSPTAISIDDGTVCVHGSPKNRAHCVRSPKSPMVNLTACRPVSSRGWRRNIVISRRQ